MSSSDKTFPLFSNYELKRTENFSNHPLEALNFSGKLLNYLAIFLIRLEAGYLLLSSIYLMIQS